MPSSQVFSDVSPGSVFAEVSPTGQYVELVTSSAGVAPTNEARLRLNGGALQVSISGAAYVAIVTGSGGITIGTSTITSGTDTRVLFDDAGVIGEDAAFTYNKTTDRLSVGELTATQLVSTTGSPAAAVLITPGAHTTLTGEAPALNIATATQQWASASGTQALLRSVIFNAPTYDMDGAATITTAITVDISGVPITGSTAAMTNRYGMRINNATVAAGALTDSASLYVVGAPQDPAGGTSRNVSAILVGGTATVRHNNAAFNYSLVNIPAHTLTLTATTQVTASPAVAGVRINTITVTDASAVTLDTCAALYIAAAPLAAGSVTMTNTYAIWVDAGITRLDGAMNGAAGSAALPGVSVGITTYGMYQDGGTVLGFSTAGVSRLTLDNSTAIVASTFSFRSSYDTTGAFYATGTTIAQIRCDGNTAMAFYAPNGGFTTARGTITQVAATSGSPTAFTITGGAHTTLAASTESTDVLWDMSRTVQFATGALTTQRQIVFDVQTTLGFVGASTITNAVGINVVGPPVEGTNAVMTNVSWMTFGTVGGVSAFTYASAASFKYRIVEVVGDTVTITGSTNNTLTTPAVCALSLPIITVSAGTAHTMANAATFYIAGAPLAGGLGPLTITKAYSLWIDAGLPRIDSVTANGTTACVLTATSGPAAAQTAVQEWLTIDINGTTRFIPCW